MESNGLHLKLPTDFLAKSSRTINGLNYSFSQRIEWDFNSSWEADEYKMGNDKANISYIDFGKVKVGCAIVR